MRTRWQAQLLFCVVLSLSAFGQDSSGGGTPAVIRALEREWVVGQSRNDNRVLNLIFDNALVYVEYGKLVSKGDYLARIKREQPHTDDIKMEPMRVQLFGNTAIVVGTYRETQIISRNTRLMRWRFVDTWIYKKSGWVLVSAAASPIQE